MTFPRFVGPCGSYFRAPTESPYRKKHVSRENFKTGKRWFNIWNSSKKVNHLKPTIFPLPTPIWPAPPFSAIICANHLSWKSKGLEDWPAWLMHWSLTLTFSCEGGRKWELQSYCGQEQAYKEHCEEFIPISKWPDLKQWLTSKGETREAGQTLAEDPDPGPEPELMKSGERNPLIEILSPYADQLWRSLVQSSSPGSPTNLTATWKHQSPSLQCQTVGDRKRPKSKIPVLQT